MNEAQEKIAKFLWDYAMGQFNTENMNLEEQMDFKATKILNILGQLGWKPPKEKPRFSVGAV